jgi:hypothetical protein
MSDLVERMRAKLAHAKAHRMIAAPVDLEDLEQLLALQPKERSRFIEISNDFIPQLSADWSRPVHVRIEKAEGNVLRLLFKRPPTLDTRDPYKANPGARPMPHPGAPR